MTDISDVLKFSTNQIVIISQKQNGAQSVPIIDYIDNLTIHESMGQLFMDGNLEMTVPKGWMASLDLKMGRQDVIVFDINSVKSLSGGQWSENDKSIVGAFTINKFDRIDLEDSSIYDRYRMSFISQEAVKDKRERIQKSYRDLKRTDIIKEIYNENVKVTSNLVGDADTDHADFFCVIPNWNPSKTINWLINGCESDDVNDFYIFQRFNSEGKIETVFDNYKNLSSQSPVVGEDDSLASGYLASFDVLETQNVETDYGQKARITLTNPMILETDFLMSSMKGVWSNRSFFYDTTTKKYTKKDYVYKDSGRDPSFPRLKKFITDSAVLETNETYNNPETSVSMYPKAKNRFDSREPEVGVDRTEQWIQKRISQKDVSTMTAIAIEVPGDTQRRVGETVMFSNFIKDDLQEDNSTKPFQHDDIGKEMGGKYLIYDIKRVFTYPIATREQPSCINKMILVRDGVPERC